MDGQPAVGSSPADSVPLSRLLDNTLERLQPLSSPSARGDGIIYCGNRHESVPRALFLDSRLTPLERNAWQVFRLLLNGDGVTAFPTYVQLSPYLASMPLADKASDETVARALTLLRLTRWLSLVRHRRDALTGRIQGNLYVLHDEPVTPFEAIQLDPQYLTLISHALTHAAKAVQRMGYHALQEVTQDPLLTGRILPSRLHLLIERLATQAATPADALPPLAEKSGREDAGAATAGESVPQPRPGIRSTNTRRHSPTSDSEAGATIPGDDALRIPKKVRTVRTNTINNKIRTVRNNLGDLSNVSLPAAFAQLRTEQQVAARAALAQVEPTVQQLVLDEWATRCQGSAVRNPAGYLFGLIQRALRGEFHAWAGKRAQEAQEHPPAAETASATRIAQQTRSKVAEQHIAKLRAILWVR